jgi:hypothetical protein
MNEGNKKGFLGIPFSWLFAIIVGSIIIFLAIYAVVKIKNVQEIAIDAQTSKQILILLNPLETGFETAVTTSMSLPSETRIFNRCDSRDNDANDYFGRQIIKVSQKSFGRWTNTNIDVGFSNKYIFSDEFVEGKKFHIFSKPFEFPFKVSDVIYITSANKNYCFVGAPREIEEEIDNLNQENLFIEECPDNSVRVCFSERCDIDVNLNLRYVEKRGEKMFFDDYALMYGAIFSDPVVYECQLKRLMKRGSQLSQIYVGKSNLVAREECFSNINSELGNLASIETGFRSSSQSLSFASEIAEDIGKINENSECELW